MTKNEKLSYYKSFLAEQLKEEIEAQKKIDESRICDLFFKEEFSWAVIDSVQPTTGLIVLKFPKTYAPRLKILKSIVIIKQKAKNELGYNPTEWTCNWKAFCNNIEYHSSGSDIVPLYYIKKEDKYYDFVVCSGISSKLFEIFRISVANGKSLTVLIHNPFPPIDYYKNLAFFIDSYSSNEELYMEPSLNYEDWNPAELAYEEENSSGISDNIMKALEEERYCIVQGPPGTGKSYTIASIVGNFLGANKKVCVTTMANKGLVELIKQEPLEKFITQGKIYKTNLSSDEKKQLEGVKVAPADLRVLDGELVCSTYYSLSYHYKEGNVYSNEVPLYDLIVIEEASQAFLATIVAFKQLAKRCLIVGDPMQLPPIENSDKSLFEAGSLDAFIHGLKTFILGSKIKTYRIVSSFRLTHKSAQLTKLFYGNNFFSIKKDYKDYTLCKSKLFPNEGGVLFYCSNDVRNAIYSHNADRIISHVVNKIVKFYPKRSLAIISPFKESVKEIQKRFSSLSKEMDITIETIDRVQGMTVDYVVLYIPGRKPKFAYDDRRFNVATSRSLSTTLIVSDVSPYKLHSISDTVLRFIANCDTVTDDFD